MPLEGVPIAVNTLDFGRLIGILRILSDGNHKRVEDVAAAIGLMELTYSVDEDKLQQLAECLIGFVNSRE